MRNLTQKRSFLNCRTVDPFFNKYLQKPKKAL
jgi:hypothetical protein